MNAHLAGWPAPSLTLADVVARLRDAYGPANRLPVQEPVDELVQTILSQHTSDSNTDRAFAALRAAFPTWDDVVTAPTEAVADAIRSGGLANIKAPRIQQVLSEIQQRVGSYDLWFLRDLPLDAARDWLTSLRGVGPKTAACVLLFSLERDALPVDTHVYRVALRLGLIPPGSNAERAHRMLEAQVGPGAAYDAHMLLIRHGRETCTARRPRCAGCVLNDECPSALRTEREQLEDGATRN